MIAATNPDQREAALKRRTPEVEEVRPGVWSIPLPLPHSGGVESTLCYGILDDEGGVALIDPGWATDQNRRRLTTWLDRVGRSVSDIRVLVVTHLHHDHLGLADELRARSGARLVLDPVDAETITHPALESDDEVFERWGVPVAERPMLGAGFAVRYGQPGFHADSPDADGLVRIPGHDLEAVRTPGHTPGHLTFASATDGLVFTGDHVLPIIHPGLGLGGPQDNPLGDYLASLEAIARFDDHEVCPGHGYRFTGLGTRRRELAAHHLGRNAQIAMLRNETPHPTVWRVAERVTWTDGWDGLHGLTRRHALAQTEMHLRYLDRIAI